MSRFTDLADSSENHTETAAALDAGIIIADPVKIGSDSANPDALIYLGPDGTPKVVDLIRELGRHQPNPARKTGTFRVHDAESFTGYIAKHGLPETEVWSDAQGQKIVGVINAHESVNGPVGVDGPAAGWGDHRVEYQVKLTDAWQAWMSLNGKLVGQTDFAAHIEDRLVDITNPDAADILELAQNFEATTNVAYESANVLATGERQFVYREQTDARAGQAGRLTIPKEFEVTIQPFEGAPLFPIVARLRYRLREGHLSIGYQLVRPEDILRAAFLAVSDAIKEGVGGTPVFHGVSAATAG